MFFRQASGFCCIYFNLSHWICSSTWIFPMNLVKLNASPNHYNTKWRGKRVKNRHLKIVSLHSTLPYRQIYCLSLNSRFLGRHSLILLLFFFLLLLIFHLFKFLPKRRYFNGNSYQNSYSLYSVKFDFGICTFCENGLVVCLSNIKWCVSTFLSISTKRFSLPTPDQNKHTHFKEAENNYRITMTMNDEKSSMLSVCMWLNADNSS